MNSDYVDVSEGSEASHMKADIESLNIPLRTFASHNQWNPPDRAIILPEQERNQLFLNVAQRKQLAEYVRKGGRLIVCGATFSGSGPRGLDFINHAFEDMYKLSAMRDGRKQAGKNVRSKTCTIFCGADPILHDRNGVASVDANSLPSNAYAAYYDETDKRKVVLLVIRHGAGLIIYFGFDWYTVQNREQWKDLLKLAILEEDVGCSSVQHTKGTASKQRFDTIIHAGFQKECATDEVLTSLYSEHDNREEDRKWSFACSKVKGVKFADCSWTTEKDSYLDKGWTLGNTDTVIVGMKSHRTDNARSMSRDRTYAIKICRVVATQALAIQQDPDWVNSYDKPLSYTLAKDRFLMRITSQHSNHFEDRIWKFTTGRLCHTDPGQCSTMVHSGKPADGNNLDTKFHNKFEKLCGKGEVLTSIYSEHLDLYEDRVFSFSCGRAPGVHLTECAWTKEKPNLLDGEWTIGSDDRIIVGLKSAGKDAVRHFTKDRTYSIRSCKVADLDVHAPITDADWANEYDHAMSYTLPETRFMTKITSKHSNLHEDRVFKFTTVELCKASTGEPEFDEQANPTKKTFEKEMALWENKYYSHVEEEVLHLKEDMKRAQIPWKVFAYFDKFSFNTRALLVPEQELEQLILKPKVEKKVLSYVSKGGTLIVCGSGDYWAPTSGKGVNLINRIFGFYIRKHGEEWGAEKAKKNVTGCGIFCSVDEVAMLASTVTVSTDSLPPQALVAFVKAEDPKATPVFTIPHQNGLVVYLGFDWYSSDPHTAWTKLLKLAYDRNA